MRLMCLVVPVAVIIRDFGRTLNALQSQNSSGFPALFASKQSRSVVQLQQNSLKEVQVVSSTKPHLQLERQIRAENGFTLIAGLDEAGRGALAGPVAAAAVILPLDAPEKLAALTEINDSKQLSAKRRAAYYDLIVENALAYGIGCGSPIRVDKEGIIAATKHAMREAIRHLGVSAEFLLIDGRISLPTIATPQQSIIRGDGSSLSIAAASILAKVTRDRYMMALDPLYPQYGFAGHKGYATPQHLAALNQYGAIALHRHSFQPVRQKLL